MANSYFQFKQFRIEQGSCAMKVCTDSCLFGAYVAVEKAGSILDIGTGTGLLALMAAQRSSARIQAVEIDPAAVEQATANFKASPWGARLKIYAGSLQDFELVNTELFDVIISNPPFYQASQKSPDRARTQAMHTVDLPFPNLLRFGQKFLKPGGSFYLLLPPYEARLIKVQAAAAGMFLQQERAILTKDAGKHIRSILEFSRQPALTPEFLPPISIRGTSNDYSPAFRQLLQPYYLIFK